jgi:hypothetical protein
MTNAQTLILFGKSKEQLDRLTDSFKRDSQIQTAKPVAKPQPISSQANADKYRKEAEQRKLGN